jgi:peroxiredoxin
MALGKGAQAPDSSFDTPEGGRLTLAAMRTAGPVLLAFYKASCPVCQLTLPFLERLRGGPLQIYTVSQDGAGAAREFDAAYELTIPAVVDNHATGYAASNAFDITHVPTLFLVEPGGEISWVSSGFMKKELEALAARAGRPIFRAGESVPEAQPG